MENKPVKSSSKTTPAPRLQLDRERWIEAAIDVLARDGVAGLRVELLAKHCGVTKGSFYWHFKDKQALLEALLDQWKEGRIRDIDKTTTVAPGKERDQLRHNAAYEPSRAISSWWVPNSMMWPSSTTATRSASCAVISRWAMATTVRPETTAASERSK